VRDAPFKDRALQIGKSLQVGKLALRQARLNADTPSVVQ
jgi:hypothetical protein